MSGWQTRDPAHVGLDPADYTDGQVPVKDPAGGFVAGEPVGGADLSDADPLPDGTADPGTSEDASRADHVHPATGGGGGGGDGEVLIQAVTLSSDGRILFTVPAGYSALRIEGRIRTVRAAGNDQAGLRFGTAGVVDDGANQYRFSCNNFGGNSGSDSGAGTFATPFGRFNVPGDTAEAGSFGYVECRILGHATTDLKTSTFGHGAFTGSPSASDNRWGSGFGEWRETSIVDRVELLGVAIADRDLKEGSWARLYGTPA